MCQKDNTARLKKYRRFLECIDHSFLAQVIEEPTKKDILLNLILMNKKVLVGDVKVGDSVGSSDCERVELRKREQRKKG